MNLKKMTKYLLNGLVLLGCVMIVYFLVFSSKKDSLFYAFQMLMGILILFVPKIVGKVFKLKVPSILENMYLIFILFAVFIGTGMGFYSKVFIWDKILHFSSAMLLVALGYAIIGLLIKDKEKFSEATNPLLITLFAFFFAMTMGVVWEFYEFTFDGLLNLNMQRFAGKVGREALLDTMEDLFINTAGAICYSLYSHYQLKTNFEYLEKISFGKNK